MMYDFAVDPYGTMAQSTTSTPSGYQFAKTKPVAGLDPLTVQFLTQNGTQGLQFFTNKGNAATGLSLGEAQRKGASGILDNNGFVALNPEARYRIRNESGKDAILYEGLGEEGLRNVYSVAQNLSATQKKKANWGVDMFDPATGQWMRVAEDDPAKNTLGKIADIALPLAGALLLPGIGGVVGALGSVGAGAAGAALGSTVSGVAQGKSIGDIAKNAALSGALSYVGGSALQGLGGASQGAGALGDLTVEGITQEALGNLTASGLGQGFTNAAVNSGIAGVGSGLGQAAGGILVEGARQSLAPAVGAALGAGAGSGLANTISSAQGGQQPDDIVVTGKPTPPVSVVPPLTTLPGVPNPAAPTTPTEPKKGFDVSKLPQYVQLAAIGMGAVESLFGGGGDGSGNGTVPGGLGGNLNPIFSASLPTDPVIPGTGGLRASQYGPRTMPVQDWNTYGTRAEQSFFNHVPQPTLAAPSPYPQAPSTPPTSEETPRVSDLPIRKAPVQLARGGSLPGASGTLDSLAVMGAGGGRDDTVPAMLSDGEYVIDAETVALLGDGSNKEGARKLDDLRVSVRKHKGRKLAKGAFSGKAKKAEAYLSGARR